jgi:hypothetical protein
MGTSTVFTAAAIEKIQAMKAAGKTSAQIARAIGSTTNSVDSRMSQLCLNNGSKPRVPRRPDVDPVEHDLGRVGTVVRDAGVYHALDAGWRHLGWFAEHHLAARAVREHHDLVATA